MLVFCFSICGIGNEDVKNVLLSGCNSEIGSPFRTFQMTYFNKELTMPTCWGIALL